METAIEVDLSHLAQRLKLPLDRVQRTVDLLDAGNTVPFITRYRKDETGGMDEEQIRAVQHEASKLRLLAERKATILKSIEAQGKLTPELAASIKAAPTTKRLEDLYLPYKPKKQTLATQARQKGLEPLADEIFDRIVTPENLIERATYFVRVDKQLHNVDEVMQGVGHILAERFSERADLRGRLRKLIWRTGKLATSLVDKEKSAAKQKDEAPPVKAEADNSSADKDVVEQPSSESANAEASSVAPDVTEKTSAPGDPSATATIEATASTSAPSDEQVAAGETAAEAVSSADEVSDIQAGETQREPVAADADQGGDSIDTQAVEVKVPVGETQATPNEGQTEVAADDSSEKATEAKPVTAASTVADKLESDSPNNATDNRTPDAKQSQPAPSVKQQKKKKKKKKKRREENPFQDYDNFEEALSKMPPHRVLAINRGERAKALRVKMLVDQQAVEEESLKSLLPDDHPHVDFLKTCILDAINRLMLPSLEREVRREMTEKAESHAVEVFAQNLRSLLLQPPIHHHRVMAVDPGFRSGCKYCAIDEFGRVLGHGVLHIVGNKQRREEGRKAFAASIQTHGCNVIAIGNGTACRETEQLVAEILGQELKDSGVKYVVVNEAGASVYSTSPVGREELPQFDAVVRGAVSIGRRLLDPLSELVKINPANIGVGMYQHDVKAKHLSESLDEVVESCVNYVGVDVNTASPALLRYVSGLNQLTAQRVYEYRQEHGPFKSREQFREVAGFGEATFVQAAGFLKIHGGDNPLDSTWIHPESYDVAERVLTNLGSNVDELVIAKPQQPPAITPASEVETQPASVESESAASESAAKAKQEEAPSAKVETTAEVSATTDDDSKNEPGSAETSAPVEPTAESETLCTEAAPAEIASDQEAPRESEAAAAQEASPAVSSSPVVEQAVAVTVIEEPSPERLAARKELVSKAEKVETKKLAGELGVGDLLLKDIVAAIVRPGRDPREDLPAPIFRSGIMKIDDLNPGMELTGTVLNVVDFGAFVDIGLHDPGLVHISRLANQYVKDPHQVVSVGDILKVWVHEIDKDRRRVSLTAIAPGTEQKPAPRPERKPKRPQGQQRRGGKPRGGKPDQGQRGKAKKFTRPPRKPKPVKPITQGMVEGKEPMRSFSDLAQFFDKKDDEPEKK